MHNVHRVFLSKREDFVFQSGNERTLKVWSMAIADRFTENANIYDYNYYQSLSDKNIENMLSISQDRSDETIRANIDVRLLKDVAKNIVKSGNFTMDGVMKGVTKASNKQARKSMFSELKDELGMTELKDEFTEVGNELRESFGLKRKKTQADIKEEQMNIVFNKQLIATRQAAFAKRGISHVQKVKAVPTIESMPLEKRIEMLKKLKELVDVGILTQEEFDTKKKEIINS